MIYFNQRLDPSRILLNYKIPLLLSYYWDHRSVCSHCILSIVNQLTYAYSRLHVYSIIPTSIYNCKIKARYVVINEDRDYGFQLDTIYQSNDDSMVLQLWLEDYIFTKEAIQAIFRRLLKRDQYNILKTKNILSRKDVFALAYDSDETDDDRI